MRSSDDAHGLVIQEWKPSKEEYVVGFVNIGKVALVSPHGD